MNEITEKKKIGKEEIAKADEILKKYKQGKTNLEKKIVENEKWWKLRHWEVIGHNDNNRPEPVSAWLFNSIANKHADAMDNYPEPNVLPRAVDDDSAAKQLSSILPVILEQNNYEEVYSDVWWYKLKQGTGVKGIFWNPSKMNGLGDVEIKKMDLLNLFWEPGISDIQDSPNFFNLELVNNDTLKTIYPDIQLGTSGNAEIAEYVYDDTVDISDKSLVVDWYYKKNNGSKSILHYVKYCNGQVLYASEDDENYVDRGYYDHGKYPFVFDKLFVVEGSPCGFGYIDVMKDCQMYIDKLNQAIIENAIMSSKKRWFVRNDGCINEDEYADFNKSFVHTDGNLGEDSIREIVTNPLSSININILNNKIDELKETSGNRDFSQGSTSNGVTAASAISALMEAGSKLSRDMLKSAYRSFTNECYLVIELIRQFYDLPRTFRITGNTGYEFTQFSNAELIPQQQGNEFGVNLGERMPVFDIKVCAAKKSTYSRMAQNELALQFYGLGFFNPDMADASLSCIDMMDFDGKDKIIEKIQKNGTLYQELMQMKEQMMKMAAIIDAQNGTQIGNGMYDDQQTRGIQNIQMPQKTQSLNDQAREKVQNSTNPNS